MKYDLDATRSYTLTLARRAARDIQEDNFRQLRGYVDMGAALSKGTGHKYFFSMAEKALSRADSIYYPLLQRMLDTMDAERLCQVMVNLGICTFTCGAMMLREQEKATGTTPPWLQGFEADAPQDPALREARVARGEGEGTYCYLARCENAEQIAAHCALAQAHPKSTFAVHAPARAYTEKTLQTIGKTLNLIPLLELSGLALENDVVALCDGLCKERIMYGLVIPVAPEETERFLSDTYLQVLAQHTMLCVCRSTEPKNKAAAKRLQKGVYQTRTGHTVQLLIFDWDADTHKVNEYLAPHAHVSLTQTDGADL